MKYSTIFSALILGLFLQNGFGKTFQNEYLSFELADNWTCTPSPPNWVCEPSLASQRRLAIITVTGKEAGSLDQISNFEAFLSKPRSHQLGSETPVMSQVMKVNRRTLNNHEWVQSMHLNSEVNNFYTLYLATVKQPMAVMVTMSAEKDKWDQFNGVFEKVIASLQVKQVQIKKAGGTGADGGVQPVASPGQSATSSLEEGLFPAENGPKKIPTVYIGGLLAALVILASAVFLVLKK